MDAAGDIVVADQLNERILFNNADGTTFKQFGATSVVIHVKPKAGSDGKTVQITLAAPGTFTPVAGAPASVDYALGDSTSATVTIVPATSQ